MYRLYHKVEVSMGFTHWGPQARGSVNHVETDTSDITDLYHGLRGPAGSRDLAQFQLKSVPSVG